MNRKDINSVIKKLLPVQSTIIGAPRHESDLHNYLELFPENGSVEFCNAESLARDFAIPVFFDSYILEAGANTFIACLNDARVWGRNGAVIGAGDYFIRDVSREFNRGMNIDHSIFYTIHQQRPQLLKGNVGVIGTAGANIYYHWMLDILPRLELISKKISIDAIDYFITEFTNLPFQSETLHKIGIDPDKIMPSNDNWHFHIKAEKLWVPSLAGELDQPSAFQIKYLRNLYKNEISPAKPLRKIYISRRKTGRREIVNEKELLAYLAAYNFEIIECENLKVAAQVKIFSEASVIICSHGSALTNLAFCNSHTKVLDIFNQSHLNPCFWFMSKILGLDYVYMQGQSVPIDDNVKNDNTLINVNEFKKIFSANGFA